MVLRKVFTPSAMAAGLKFHQVLRARVCAIMTFPSIVPHHVTRMLMMMISDNGGFHSSCQHLLSRSCVNQMSRVNQHPVLSWGQDCPNQTQLTVCLSSLLTMSCVVSFADDEVCDDDGSTCTLSTHAESLGSSVVLVGFRFHKFRLPLNENPHLHCP